MDKNINEELKSAMQYSLDNWDKVNEETKANPIKLELCFQKQWKLPVRAVKSC